MHEGTRTQSPFPLRQTESCSEWCMLDVSSYLGRNVRSQQFGGSRDWHVECQLGSLTIWGFDSCLGTVCS